MTGFLPSVRFVPIFFPRQWKSFLPQPKRARAEYVTLVCEQTGKWNIDLLISMFNLEGVEDGDNRIRVTEATIVEAQQI